MGVKSPPKSSNDVDDMFCRKHNAGYAEGLLQVILVRGIEELMEWLVRLRCGKRHWRPFLTQSSSW